MSEYQRNLENLRAIREGLVKSRQEKASYVVRMNNFENVDDLIEIQRKIEMIDRAISDEVKHFDPDAWGKLAGL